MKNQERTAKRTSAEGGVYKSFDSKGVDRDEASDVEAMRERTKQLVIAKD